MKNKYLLSLLWVIVSGFGILMAQEIAIIPQPAHLIVKNESFKFGKQLKVCIASYRGDRKSTRLNSSHPSSSRMPSSA